MIKAFTLYQPRYSLLPVINGSILSIIEQNNAFNKEVNVKRREVLEQITKFKKLQEAVKIKMEEFRSLPNDQQMKVLDKVKNWSSIVPPEQLNISFHGH